MYELIILTLLMQGSIHGYLIIKIMNDIVGPFTKLSHGRLYPLLARLEAGGLIVTSQEETVMRNERRRLRAYQITEKGRDRFHELMTDTISNPSEYQKLFSYKVQGLEFLRLEEQLLLLDHYANFCQTHMLYLSARIDEMKRRAARKEIKISPMRLDMTLNLIQHAVEQWHLELDWVNQLHQHIVERQE